MRVIQEDPVEVAVVARRLFQRPLVGGLRIASSVGLCTSGFGAAGDPQTFDFWYRGIPFGASGALRPLVFSAGHCAKRRDDDNWSQGGRIFGDTRAWSFEDDTAADAMVIRTKRSFVSPWIYLYKDFDSRVIVRKIGSVRDLRKDDVGQKVCSPARPRARQTNAVWLPRFRNSINVRIPGTNVSARLKSQRRMNIPCKPGDSGAPVYRDDDEERTEAIGIVTAGTARSCYYALIVHAINVLRDGHSVKDLRVLISRPTRQVG